MLLAEPDCIAARSGFTLCDPQIEQLGKAGFQTQEGNTRSPLFLTCTASRSKQK